MLHRRAPPSMASNSVDVICYDGCSLASPTTAREAWPIRRDFALREARLSLMMRAVADAEARRADVELLRVRWRLLMRRA